MLEHSIEGCTEYTGTPLCKRYPHKHTVKHLVKKLSYPSTIIIPDMSRARHRPIQDLRTEYLHCDMFSLMCHISGENNSISTVLQELRNLLRQGLVPPSFPAWFKAGS